MVFTSSKIKKSSPALAASNKKLPASTSHLLLESIQSEAVSFKSSHHELELAEALARYNCLPSFDICTLSL